MSHNLGLQTIPVAKIKGSVHRYEFDRGFLPEYADKEKLFHIQKAYDEYTTEDLPPISVYKINDEYYVIDGNHRVVAANVNHQIDIDAEVTEIKPHDPGHQLLLEKIDFRRLTGISTLEFKEIGSYPRIINYIHYWVWCHENKKHLLKDAAEIWYKRQYHYLLISLNEYKNDILSCEYTIDDICFYILNQATKSHLQKQRHGQQPVDLKNALTNFNFQTGTDIKECTTNIFKEFVYINQCEKPCLKCIDNCPQQIIRQKEDNELVIDGNCDGCGKCSIDCLRTNLLSYNEYLQLMKRHAFIQN